MRYMRLKGVKDDEKGTTYQVVVVDENGLTISDHTDVELAAEAAARVAHEADTTAVHGIADTSQLVTQAVANATYSGGVEATQRLMRKLDAEVSDASILVIGDSTGDGSTDWVYRLTEALADDWPEWSVDYRLAVDGSSAYSAATSVQVGSGARTLTVYNASIPGYHALHFQGTRAGWAIFPLEPDLIFISLGHNEASTPESLIHSRMVSLTESVTERLSGDVILVAQNPATADENQQVRAQVYRDIATARGFGFIDVMKAFLDTGAAPGLTTDGIHPNTAGSTLWAATVHAAFQYQPAIVPKPQPPSPLTSAGPQLLINGDFASLPDHSLSALAYGGWWADANTAITQDATNYESPRGYGIKLTATAAALARFGQRIKAHAYRNQWVTVAWRVFIPSGQAQTVGWIYLDDGVGNSTAIPGTYSGGAFQWIIASVKVGATATDLDTLLLLSGINAAAANVTVDRVILTLGKFPRATPENLGRATLADLDGLASLESGSGSPAGVVSATAGALYTRTDVGDRTNEAIYPISDGSSATTGWFATGGALTNPGGYLRNTISTTTGTRNIQNPNGTTQPAVPSKQYTVTAQARSNTAGLEVRILAQFYTSGGVATGSLSVGAYLNVSGGTFLTLPAVTLTAPADAAYLLLRVVAGAQASIVGDTLDVRHWLIEQAAAADTYFDGSSSGASWTGTADASSSTLPSTEPALYVKTGSPSVASTSGWIALARA